MDDIKTCYRCTEPLTEGEEHLCSVEIPEEEDDAPVWGDEKEEEHDE